LSALLRLISAGALFAAAAAHAAVWGTSMQDPMGWILDAVIVALALLIAFPVVRRISARTGERATTVNSS
jgi:hypothetical protein